MCSQTVASTHPCMAALQTESNNAWEFLKKAGEDGAEFLKKNLNSDIIAPAISMSIVLLGTYAGYKAIEVFFRELSSPQSGLFAPEQGFFSPSPVYRNPFSFLVDIILFPIYLPFMIILLPFQALYEINRIALTSILMISLIFLPLALMAPILI